MTEVRRFSLVKPNIHTRFHVDFNWWGQSDRDWRVYLQNLLCHEHRKVFANFQASEMVDSVDPETAEVQRVDGLQHILITHCSREPGFITDRTTLVDAVFRVFLANSNEPLSVQELADKLNRSPEVILKTFSSGQVYKGIRPVIDR